MSTGPVNAILRMEYIVDYLQEQLQDAREGMSLRQPGDVKRELDIAEAKLKRLRSGQCRVGEAA
ncbi:MAG: hypothetical protein IAE66_06250 [Xanthomonadaceae bacterium]|nr:hypothetical protein [Xanthomonadaceae bacterium]